MKKLLLTLFALCALNCNAQHLYGDVNHDGVISVADVNILVNIILGRQDAEEIKIEDLLPKTYTINGVEYPMPEAVDLGLPSGNLWASCNLGAKDDTEYGFEFNYADLTPYAYYCINNDYKLPFEPIENYSIANTQFDASTYYLGKNWMMPLSKDAEELVEYTNLEITYVQNKMFFVLTSKIEGFTDKCICFPTNNYNYSSVTLANLGKVFYDIEPIPLVNTLFIPLNKGGVDYAGVACFDDIFATNTIRPIQKKNK